MPTLLVWLGQFLVPLRHLTGSIDPALLIVNICAATATLSLLYWLARSLGNNLAGRLAAVTVCGGATLFIGLSRHYFTEPLQTACAAASMVIAWRSEQRSAMRNTALVILLISVSLLAKSSSGTFVLPALVYIAVALYATRGDTRPRSTHSDLAWFVLSLVIAALAVTWYATNWVTMSEHFLSATVGDVALNYGSPVILGEKLKYWSGELAKALAAFQLTPIVLIAVITVAVVVSYRRQFGKRTGNIVRQFVTSGALFGIYLAGTITAIVISYSLQINQDQRFLLPLIPIVSGLVAWSLAVLDRQVLSLSILALFTANAAIANAVTLGTLPPSKMPYVWLWQAYESVDRREAIDRVTAATCDQNTGNKPIVIGVSYPELNANTASYFGAKHYLRSGIQCTYLSLPQDDLAMSMDWLGYAGVKYVVTVAPERQDKPDFVNKISLPVAQQLISDARFSLVPASDEYFKIYRRLDESDIINGKQ